MKRKLYQDLLRWKKESQGRSALLINGARRVGKSYLAKQFGEKEYKSMIMINFTYVDKEVLKIFEEDATDLDMFFSKI